MGDNGSKVDLVVLFAARMPASTILMSCYHAPFAGNALDDEDQSLGLEAFRQPPPTVSRARAFAAEFAIFPTEPSGSFV